MAAEPNLRDLERADVLQYLSDKLRSARKHAEGKCECPRVHTPAEVDAFTQAKHIYGALYGDIQTGLHIRDA